MKTRSVPRLMLVTDRMQSCYPLPELARLAVEGGVDAVQIREKDLSSAQSRALIEQVLDAVAGRAQVIIDGQPELAADMGIGLHLPESMPDPVEITSGWSRIALIGRSVHSVEAARKSKGMDYLIAGHVFETSSKAGLAPIGLDGLSEIVTAASCPVLAIGGILPEHVPLVLATGAHGVAVMSGIGAAADPAAAAREYRIQLDGGIMVKETEHSQVSVTVNGKSVELPVETSIQEFLDSRKLHQNMVVVEHNGQILKRGQFTETRITAGDVLEVVHVVGGG